MSRKLTGRPSALGKQLLHDICPAPKPLQGCHCAPMVWGFWVDKLPQSIKIQLADKVFNANTYNEIFTHADEVWEADGGSTAAEPAVVATTTTSTATDQVAAVARGRGNRGRANRARGQNRGRGRGGRGGQNGNSQTTTPASTTAFVNTGPRHSDLPPPSCCSEHWRRGSSATFCYSPLDCPWKDRIVPRQNVTKNTNSN